MSIFALNIPAYKMAAHIESATTTISMSPSHEEVVGHALVTGRSPRGMCGNAFATHILSFDWEKRWQAQLLFDRSTAAVQIIQDRKVLMMAINSNSCEDTTRSLGRLVGMSKTIGRA